MDKDSTLTSLDMTGGRVNYAIEGARFGRLTTADLSGGNGLFYMRTDIVGDGAGNNSGDLLVVTRDSAGHHLVNVTNSGSAQTDGTERLTIIDTFDSQATFALDYDVEVGAFLYGLRRVPGQEDDWELYSTGQKSTTAQNSAGLINTVYLLNYLENQTLLQRLGELRHSPEPEGDVWIRYYGGRFSAFGDQRVAGSKMNYHGLQFGADKNVRSDAESDIYLGVVGGLSRGKLDFAVGHGKTTSYYGGLYGTYKHTEGYYVDVVLKYFHMDNDLDTWTAGGDPVQGSGDSKGYTASLELGKRFFLNERTPEEPGAWFVEPQGQITYGHYNAVTINSSHGLVTRFDDFDSCLGRLGFLFGYSTVVEDAGPVDVYVKGNYLKEFKGDTAYTYNSAAREEYGFDGHWLEVGLGANMQLKENHNLYADFIYADGDKFNQSQINLGYRFNF